MLDSFNFHTNIIMDQQVIQVSTKHNAKTTQVRITTTTEVLSSNEMICMNILNS